MKGVSVFVLLVAVAVGVSSCGDCPTDGSEKYLKHEDCNKFYQCVHGEKVARLCPSNLFFNETINLCDWPEHVDCTGRNIPVSSEEFIN